MVVLMQLQCELMVHDHKPCQPPNDVIYSYKTFPQCSSAQVNSQMDKIISNDTKEMYVIGHPDYLPKDN